MATGTSILIQAAGVGTTAVGHLREGTTDRPLAVQLASAGTFGLVVGRITYELIPHTGAEMHDSRGGVASICATQTSHPRRPLSGTGPAIGILMLAMAAGLTMSEVLL